MKEESAGTQPDGSTICPEYSSGEYFSDHRRYADDAPFKAQGFLNLFLRFSTLNSLRINSLIDVGCGSGEVVAILKTRLEENGFDLKTVKGYDVYPGVENLTREGIDYVRADFCRSDDFADLVTLFDVVEHVPDPIGFMARIAQRCNMVALHLPLDNSFNYAVRDRFRSRLRDPGHLLVMDSAYALNLLAMAGLKVVDYDYTHSFQSPSGCCSLLAKVAFPFRYAMARVSPWLLSKTLGGVSMMALALTPAGAEKISLSK